LRICEHLLLAIERMEQVVEMRQADDTDGEKS
jgi:hypothetical protein